MVSVKKLGGRNATMPVLKAGRRVGISNAQGIILRMKIIGPVEPDAFTNETLAMMNVQMVGYLVGTGHQASEEHATIHLLAFSLAMEDAFIMNLVMNSVLKDLISAQSVTQTRITDKSATRIMTQAPFTNTKGFAGGRIQLTCRLVLELNE